MKPRPEPTSQEVLAGLVERVTYHNEESGFCVLRIKARGHRDLVTVIGHSAVISAGEWVTASGEWVNDRTHGQQYRAKFLKTSEPTSLDGIEKYLGSGMIRGIGPVYAKKLVRAFGEKVFDTIEAQPERLREVTGIGAVRAGRITVAWAEQKIVREIMVFLHSHGVGTASYVENVNADDGELAANFDSRTVTYGFGELDTLVPAYAATIHKSQGSEYPAVVIPVLTQHYAMLQRNLLYTGVTRGKRLVVLVGQKKAVAIAVRNVSGRRRWSKLGEWLCPGPPALPAIGVAG
jgi:ATP-dependent exoDNAse (exonuclease V) alpha subunit